MATTSLRVRIGANISEAEKAFKELGNTINRFGKRFSDFGKVWSASISAPLLGLGGLAAKVGFDVKGALNDIRIGTGATGEAFKGLEADFRAIVASVPQSFGESAKAIADFNTMLGSTGKELQELSTTGLDVSRMLKLDLGSVISSTTKAMNSWGIAAKGGVGFMDKLFVASQNTGMGMDKIADGMSKFGPAFRSLGFETEQVMAIIGQLDKHGVQADSVLGSLNKALATLAKEGIKDAGKAFGQIINSIRSAKDEQAAMTLAIETFGSKVSTHMVRAIREGKFGVDELVGALHNADGAIRSTAEETDGFSEQWARTKNAISMALEPLGTKILSVAEKELKSYSGWLEKANLDLSEGTIKFAAYAAALGPATIAIGAFVSSIGTLIKATSTMNALMLSTPFGFMMTSIAVLVGGLVTLENTYGKIGDAAGKTKQEIKDLADATEIATQRVLENANANPWAVMGVSASGRAAPTEDDIQQVVNKRVQNAMKEKRVQAALDQAERIRRSKDPTVEPGAAALANIVTTDPGKFAGYKNKGKTPIELFAEGVRDRMKYMDEPGEKFLAQIEEMQAKLKPLTKDWKALADLKIDINDDGFTKKIQEMQYQIQYLNKDGKEFLPDLEKMKDQFKLSLTQKKQLEDAVKGIMEKQWSDLSWDFSQGLLQSGEYARLLKSEIDNLTRGTEEWKNRFTELQSLKGTEIDKAIESLSRQFDTGKLSSAEYESALASLAGQYADFPLAVRKATEELKMFQRQTEITAVPTGRALSDALRNATKEFRELEGQGILGVVDGFLRASISGEDFGASLRKLGEDIVYTTLRMVILNQVMPMFGGGAVAGAGNVLSSAWGANNSVAGNYFGNVSAEGNAFPGGNVIPFAKGGVIPRPTVFPMADGVGLMGEAGPEAVMPLERDSSGRLGVRASGGGAPIVNITIENQTGEQMEVETTGVNWDERIGEISVNAVVKNIGNNGVLARMLKSRR